MNSIEKGEILHNNHNISPELLKKVYSLCFEYAVSLLGKKKSGELLYSSYHTILPYFQTLEKFVPDAHWELDIRIESLSEKELLAFTVWIQQFIRELKNFVVGLGSFNITHLTGEVKEELEQIGFYEYYRQAEELKY